MKDGSLEVPLVDFRKSRPFEGSFSSAANDEFLIRQQGVAALAGREIERLEGLVEDYFESYGSARRSARGFAAVVARSKASPEGIDMMHRKATTEKQRQQRVLRARNIATTVMLMQADRRQLLLAIAICTVSMIGMFMMVVAAIISWVPRTFRTEGGPPPDYELSGTSRTALLAATYLQLLLVILITVLIVLLYRQQLVMKRRLWAQVGNRDVVPRAASYSFLRSTLKWYALAEIVIHALIQTPWYNVLQNPDAKYFDIVMLLRIYTVIRVLHLRAPIYRERFSILNSNRVLRVANFSVGIADTMKYYFYRYTSLSAGLMWTFVAVVGGFAVFIAERDINNGFDPIPPSPGLSGLGFNTLFESVYFMVVSMRTIGYGDIKPITAVGRAMLILFQFTGMSVESLIGSIVINRIAKTPEEATVDGYLEAFTAWHELRVCAAMVVQAAWKSSVGYRFRNGRATREEFDRYIRAQQRIQRYRFNFISGVTARATKRSRREDGDVGRVEREITNKELLTTLDAILKHHGAQKHDAELAAEVGVSARLSENEEIKRYFAVQVSEGDPDDGKVTTRYSYLRQRPPEGRSETFIKMYKPLFASHNVLERAKGFGDKPPAGFEPLRTFSQTHTVIDKNGTSRRVPTYGGHKSNILMQALGSFRTALLQFKHSVEPSTDQTLDRNINLMFELATRCSKRLRRNAEGLAGTRQRLRTMLDATDRAVQLAIGGDHSLVSDL